MVYTQTQGGEKEDRNALRFVRQLESREEHACLSHTGLHREPPTSSKRQLLVQRAPMSNSSATELTGNSLAFWKHSALEILSYPCAFLPCLVCCFVILLNVNVVFEMQGKTLTPPPPPPGGTPEARAEDCWGSAKQFLQKGRRSVSWSHGVFRN